MTERRCANMRMGGFYMWTRAELKAQAKAGLKQYYWYGFLVLLIYAAISAVAGLILGIIPFISTIAVPLANIFLLNVISVGVYRYYTISTLTGKNAGVGEMFACLKGDGYLNVVKIMFFKGLFQTLWTLLLIVPGIVKGYEYMMVPYLAAEFPEKNRKEIFQMSKEMMDGNKFNAFVLDLSFIGWYLLGIICCCIGICFVAPYHTATIAELYLALRQERLGIPRGQGEGNHQMEDDAVTRRVEGVTGGENILPPPAAKGFLKGIQGAFAGAQIPVNSGDELTIGSDPAKCSLVIQGPEVSPLHLRVRFYSTGFQVVDCSEAGTFDMQRGRLPKGQPVTVHSGTYLQIGTGGDIFSLEIRS